MILGQVVYICCGIFYFLSEEHLVNLVIECAYAKIECTYMKSMLFKVCFEFTLRSSDSEKSVSRSYVRKGWATAR